MITGHTKNIVPRPAEASICVVLCIMITEPGCCFWVKIAGAKGEVYSFPVTS